MGSSQFSVSEKIASLSSLANVFIALIMFEVISPTYHTITSILFNNGLVLIFFIVGTYLAFGRDVQAFTEHPNRIYVFARIVAPAIGIFFFAENIATYTGFAAFFANVGGIATSLATVIFGAIDEIRNHSGPDAIEEPDIAAQELERILAEEEQKKLACKTGAEAVIHRVQTCE